jgi:hypothetical protein
MWQLASDCRHPASALLMLALTTTQVKVNLKLVVDRSKMAKIEHAFNG